MICYMDTTYCVSPGCTNECGRKLTPEIIAAARAWWGTDDPPIAVSEFCEPKEAKPCPPPTQ